MAGGPAAAVFPGWILVMTVAAMVIYEYSPRVDPGLQRATIVCNFLVAFAAFVTTAALAVLLGRGFRLRTTRPDETRRLFDQSMAPPTDLRDYLRKGARAKERQ